MSEEREGVVARGPSEGAETPPFTPEQMAWLDRVIVARSSRAPPTGPVSAASPPGGSGLVTAASLPGEWGPRMMGPHNLER